MVWTKQDELDPLKTNWAYLNRFEPIKRQGISTFLLKSKMNEISHQLAINPAEILDQCVLNDDVGSVVVMETPCLNSTWSY
jgi:hypothetical protein